MECSLQQWGEKNKEGECMHSISVISSFCSMHDKGLTCIHSQCGYDHSEAHTKTQQTAVSFTWCSAHVEVTLYGLSSMVFCTHGVLKYNDICYKAGLT